jgi:hypothetical protein
MFTKMEEEFQKIMRKIEVLEIEHQEYRAKVGNISNRIEKEESDIKKRIERFEFLCIKNSVFV